MTVEVLNTDAEGRLVLADALAYGQELEPTAMIDLATLTGAQVVALGSRIAGLMGTDDDLLSTLTAAGTAAGEPLWRLPLASEYREHLRSEVADLKNIGKAREAPTIVAGLFLKEFTGEVPWAHLDIAGPAFDDAGDDGIIPKGATGFGVRTLVRYLETLG
jgi:leucyl aminopeptidase